MNGIELQKRYQLFIGGKWRDASDGAVFTTTCPADGRVLAIGLNSKTDESPVSRISFPRHRVSIYSLSEFWLYALPPFYFLQLSAAAIHSTYDNTCQTAEQSSYYIDNPRTIP